MSNPNQPAPAATPEQGGQPAIIHYTQPPKQREHWTRVWLGRTLIFALIASLLINGYQFVLLQSVFSSGPREIAYADGARSHRIVILPVNGLINDETDQFVRRALQNLADDPPQAIVLRIDSGGGTVGASDRIWERIRQFKQEHEIPVVASFGGIAASGGYYIATPADAIYAETTTLTGSIGVIAMGFTIQDMLDKLGISPEVIVSSDSTQKDWFALHRPWSDEERDYRKVLLDDAYERFIEVIHETRSDRLDESEIRELATGAVFHARHAHENQLVDEIGYLDDAIAHATELADIPADVKPRVTVVQRPGGLSLRNLLHAGQANSLEFSADTVRDWAAELKTPRIMYHVGSF